MSAPAPCKHCGKADNLSAPLVVLVVWTAKGKPSPLIPDDEYDYRICMHQTCGAMSAFVDKAIRSHRLERDLREWLCATLLFADGTGVKVSTPVAVGMRS